MKHDDILTSINLQIEAESGLDQHRPYLGISKIGNCPRETYNEYVNGQGAPTEAAHRFCFAGYEHERSVLSLLQRSGVGCTNNGYEVVAPFDARLRGHIDGLTTGGELLEIKSLSRDKFDRVQADQRVINKHFAQVQLYMRYGGWRMAYVIYRDRDTYRHMVLPVPYQPGTAAHLESKAKAILAAIDAGTPPPCECGRCEGR